MEKTTNDVKALTANAALMQSIHSVNVTPFCFSDRFVHKTAVMATFLAIHRKTLHSTAF